MPNDPRVKFKKRIYDSSRNFMYEERTGGGGGNYPGGGGYVPPSPIPYPDKPPPFNPLPHVDPCEPNDS